jgi:DNA polymerase-1
MNSKVSATYLEAFMSGMDFNHRIHGQFSQTGTVTGRLSSAKPNLQNQAKTGGTADQKAYEKVIGEKDEEAINRLVRTLFIAPPDHLLVSCDFSQIEYRTAVWYSQDKAMIDAWLQNPRLDYHDATMELLGLDRDLCKTINFGTLYGMSANGLAATLTAMGRPTSKAQAQQILNDMFAKRPALRDLINHVGSFAQRYGYVQNMYGRVVEVPREFSYKGLNYLVQGHCGDMMREALVRVAKLIKARGWPIKILLSVHDEIVYQIPTKLVAETAPELAAEMCRCGNMGVPILSDIEVGRRWSDQVPFKTFLEKGVA